MQLVLNLLVFNFWFSKGKREKIKGGQKKGIGLFLWKSFQPEGAELATIGGGTTAMIAYLLCWRLCDQNHGSDIRTQISNIWRIESFLLTLAPTDCMHVALEISAQLPATGLGRDTGSCFCANFGRKVTKIN